MPFIPHTEDDTSKMLETIGVSSIEQLFDEIPKALLAKSIDIDEALSEQALVQRFETLASKMKTGSNFIGAGAYEHFIPKAVWDLAMRGEFLTAYTPYQAEASQGHLQVIFEYQTMMASLMGLEVSNASLYDGATALAESALMACRLQRKKEKQRILVAKSMHPHYRYVLKTLLTVQDIEIIEVDLGQNGSLDLSALDPYSDFSALCIQNPNFFGRLEEVDMLTNWAHARGALVIGTVNPMAMAWLKPPGKWGDRGADIACGDGQPLGVPLSGGGPYYGFCCTKKAYVRELPGRLVSKAYDRENRRGFVLTLQAREQHIRRGKAKSNICTNQGLVVVASTIYMALLGPTGLQNVARRSHELLSYFIKQLKTHCPKVRVLFDGPHFHEVAVTLPKGGYEKLQKKGFQAGIELKHYYPEYDDAVLFCITETKTTDDIDTFVEAIKELE